MMTNRRHPRHAAIAGAPALLRRLFARGRFRLYLTGLLSLSLPVAATETPAPDLTPPVYSFAVVPQFTPIKTEQIWRPILKTIEESSGIRLDLVVPTSIPAFEHALYEGKYDFAYMNPYHLLVAHAKQGYRPLLADISRQMHGIVVVRKHGPIDSIEALAGRRMAFPAPNAFAASLLVRAGLRREFKISVTPWYVVNHSSVYLDVAIGLVPAGGGVLSTLRKQPETIQNRLRILYRTPGTPTHPIAVNPRLVPEEATRRVVQAFLQLTHSASGRRLLAAIPIYQIGRVEYSRYKPLERLELGKFAAPE